jgi:hypothetical protein
MSSYRPRTSRPLPSRRETARRSRRRFALATAAAGLLLAVAVAAGIDPDAGSRPLARTGEWNDMGMPVVRTPGHPTGTSDVAGVVVEGATWNLGQVPLGVAVRPTWTIRNTSDAPVDLGDPQVEIRDGCCPGPIDLPARTLAPGGSTTVTFELGMHPGMGGPHDLALHIPLTSNGHTESLVIDVNGDFGN